MKIKTSELTGAALDWAVAKATCEETVICKPGESRFDIRGGIHCNRYGCTYGPPRFDGEHEVYEPTDDWEITGPLIERYKATVGAYHRGENLRHMWAYAGSAVEGYPVQIGDTHLIATCRAIVAAELGPEVEIPEELACT